MAPPRAVSKLRGRVGPKANTLLRLLAPEQAKTYRIPSPLTLSGDIDIRRGRYVGDLTAEESTGKLQLKGHFTEATKTYDLVLKAQDIDGRHFMPQDSIGLVSLAVALQGRRLRSTQSPYAALYPRPTA